MKKSFVFNVKGHEVEIKNSWFGGAKLYVDGELRDFDDTTLALRENVLLQTRLAEHGILEIVPHSRLISVELDAYLRTDAQRIHVFSSDKRLSLRQRALAQK